MKKSGLLPIYIIYFLDNFSFASLFPLFSTLILSSESILLPQNYDLIMRNMLYGALAGAFPLGVFFGSPLIGNAADFWGRKKIFYFTLAGILIGNLFTALSLYVSSYFLLVLSRLITGLFSSNLTLCFAVTSDLSPTATLRSKNFGTMAAISGISWIVAIFLGSLMADAHFSPIAPFLISAAIAALNMIIVTFFYEETAPPIKKKFNFVYGMNNVMYTFHSSKIRKLTGVLLIFSIGWMITLQWFSGFSMEKFQVTQKEVITACFILGLFWIFGSLLLNRLFVRIMRLPKIPFFALLLLSIILGLTGSFNHFSFYTLFNVLAACLASLILSNLLNLFSLSAASDAQGKILGIGQSAIAAAEFIAPMLGALFLIGGFAHFYHFIGLITLSAFFLLWSDMSLLNNQRGPKL